jgi:hypothetical protein
VVKAAEYGSSLLSAESVPIRGHLLPCSEEQRGCQIGSRAPATDASLCITQEICCEGPFEEASGPGVLRAEPTRPAEMSWAVCHNDGRLRGCQQPYVACGYAASAETQLLATIPLRRIP